MRAASADPGLNLPDSPFGCDAEEQNDVEKMMNDEDRAADKETWFPNHRDCSCCKGYVYACTAEVCVQLGICGCTMEGEDVS